MRFALSTNWCNRRLESGEAIVDEALSLGFDALELGFCTTYEQAEGVRRRLDEIPVGSIHAFCPVPISAPQGHPELYQFASMDESARAIARVHVRRNVEFAAGIGASAVVLHAGRVPFRGFFSRWDAKRRSKRGAKLVDVFRRELDALVPVLEGCGVVLGLENLPYAEGFPSADEMTGLVGDWVKPWFDTGHDFVIPGCRADPVGMHVNDSAGGDDHLPPGEGKIDFSQFRAMAEAARHVVLEPNPDVTRESLAKGLEFIRKVWS